MLRRVRIHAWLIVLVTGLGAQAAGAALLRYDLLDYSIGQFDISSPKLTFALPEPGVPPGVVVVDDSAASPLLRKLVMTGDSSRTTLVPQLSGFIWFGLRFKQGPNGEFTGTGSSASSIAWGQVTGWTITGATFCNAAPSFICDFAVASQLATVEPDLRSSLYDIGTWVFHGTGFTSSGFVFFTTTLPGNQQNFLKGPLAPTGSVPALPALGLGALGASLLAMAFAAIRQRTR